MTAASGPRSRSATNVLQVEHVPVDALHLDPANPRRISEAELDALARSITEFGFVQPVVVRGDDTVIAGHQRLVAAQRLGLAEVPVIRLDVGAEQGRLLGLALNNIGGSWDEQLLARLLSDLQDDVDIRLSGFGDDELKNLLRSLEARDMRERPESFDLDEALEATKRPRTKPGDVWRLGEHRLLCGDATKAKDVARVLDGRQAGLGWSDPPYNIKLGDHGGRDHAECGVDVAKSAHTGPSVRCRGERMAH